MIVVKLQVWEMWKMKIESELKLNRKLPFYLPVPKREHEESTSQVGSKNINSHCLVSPVNSVNSIVWTVGAAFTLCLLCQWHATSMIHGYDQCNWKITSLPSCLVVPSFYHTTNSRNYRLHFAFKNNWLAILKDFAIFTFVVFFRLWLRNFTQFA